MNEQNFKVIKSVVGSWNCNFGWLVVQWSSATPGQSSLWSSHKTHWHRWDKRKVGDDIWIHADSVQGIKARWNTGSLHWNHTRGWWVLLGWESPTTTKLLIVGQSCIIKVNNIWSSLTPLGLDFFEGFPSSLLLVSKSFEQHFGDIKYFILHVIHTQIFSQDWSLELLSFSQAGKFLSLNLPWSVI